MVVTRSKHDVGHLNGSAVALGELHLWATTSPFSPPPAPGPTLWLSVSQGDCSREPVHVGPPGFVLWGLAASHVAPCRGRRPRGRTCQNSLCRAEQQSAVRLCVLLVHHQWTRGFLPAFAICQ